MTEHIQWTFIGVPVTSDTGTDVVTLTLSVAEQASEVGRYLNDVNQSATGWLSGAEFAARWSGRLIGGVQVEWRAEHAVEALRQAGPPPGAERYRRSGRRDPS
jgi:hypothetical protein